MKIEGKRKITAFIVTVAVAAVNTFIANQQVAQGVAQAIEAYLPTLLFLLFGGGYIGVQGYIDARKEAVKKVEAEARAKSAGQLVSEPSSINVVAEHGYFDREEFEKLVIKTAKYHLGVDDPENKPEALFYAASSVASVTPCKSLGEALGFWDYYLEKGEIAWKKETGFDFPYTNDKWEEERLKLIAQNPDACIPATIESYARRKSVGVYRLLLDIRHAARILDNLQKIEAAGGEWKIDLSGREPTLWQVGVLQPTRKTEVS